MGDAWTPGDAAQDAFLYSNGTISAISGPYAEAEAINASGQVAGWNGSAFLYSNGLLSNLGGTYALGINDSGEVVGQANGDAFLYSDGKHRPHLDSLIAGGAESV